MSHSTPRSPPRAHSHSRSPSRSRSRSASPRASTPEDPACPFLIRVFVTRTHTPLRDFDDGRLPTKDEFHVYGWKTSTPTSLTQQLYAVLPAPYRSPVARYSFKHVYVDASEAGLYKARELVTFTGREFAATVDGSGEGRAVTEETLDEAGFIKGDLLSVAVSVPEPPRREANRDLPRDRDGPRDRRPLPPPQPRGAGGAGGGWRDRDRDAPRNDRWGRRSRSRSPAGRRDSWRGRD